MRGSFAGRERDWNTRNCRDAKKLSTRQRRHTSARHQCGVGNSRQSAHCLPYRHRLMRHQSRLQFGSARTSRLIVRFSQHDHILELLRAQRSANPMRICADLSRLARARRLKSINVCTSPPRNQEVRADVSRASSDTQLRDPLLPRPTGLVVLTQHTLPRG